jgi:hypothetical protein
MAALGGQEYRKGMRKSQGYAIKWRSYGGGKPYNGRNAKERYENNLGVDKEKAFG